MNPEHKPAHIEQSKTLCKTHIHHSLRIGRARTTLGGSRLATSLMLASNFRFGYLGIQPLIRKTQRTGVHKPNG